MMEERPKISVIIPVYNVKDCLNECVDSVLRQSYDNFEIILIDDGSTDGSAEICDIYTAVDIRVRTVHKSNAGVASARKYGMQMASGEYVMFIDGDDWIDENTLEKCLRAFRLYPKLDCVLFSYSKEYEDHSVKMHIFDKSMHMRGRVLQYKVYRRLFGLTSDELVHPERMETMASCCMKLYTASCARRGRYFDIKDIGSSEDALFNMYALADIKEAVYLDHCFYHYRKRRGTQTSTFRPRLREQWGNLFRIMGGIIEEKGLDDSYKEALSNRIALSITAISLNVMSNENYNAIQKVKEIRSYLSDENYQRYCRRISIRSLPVPWRVYILCAKLRLSVLVYFLSVMIELIRKR